MNMMKHILNLLIATTIVSVLSGCSAMRQVSAEEFMSIADRADDPPANSFNESIRIIGITSDRAYLEYRPAIPYSGPRVRVYWTPLSGLPQEFRAQLTRRDYPAFWTVDTKLEEIKVMPFEEVNIIRIGDDE